MHLKTSESRLFVESFMKLQLDGGDLLDFLMSWAPWPKHAKT